MKANLRWSYRPYRPLLSDEEDLYICRLAPEKNGCAVEWLPADEGMYSVFLRRYRSEDTFVKVLETDKCRAKIEGLDERCDYEFYITCKEKKSRVRLFRTGEVFGTVVNYLHPEDECYLFSGRYLCSPSLAKSDEGILFASMDVYAPDKPQNLTLLYTSKDGGKTWSYLTELFPCFWAKLFFHRGELYVLSVTTEYGDLQISKSSDNGLSFQAPTLLLKGSNGRGGEPGVHKNPQPVVNYRGRLWNTLEYGSWGKRSFASMVMSCNENDDLCDAGNWVFSEPVPYDEHWEGTAKGPTVGTIEGCLAVCPDGKLRNYMRYEMHNCQPNYGRILSFVVNTDEPNAPLVYDGAVEFPGNHSKFVICYDEKTKNYLSVVCYIRGEKHANDRNLCTLLVSEDLKHWNVATHLVDETQSDPRQVGIQYVDFLIDGEDLLLLCRTAMNGAHNYHDNNYSIFRRVENFRRYLERK